jgi:site-specific DNA recombinase
MEAAGGCVTTPPAAWHRRAHLTDEAQTMPEKHIRAVAYYRMSTGRQEASIPEQKAWAEKACRKEGVDILRAFEDHGISGSEIGQRPEFLALLTYCEDQAARGTPVEAVVCWDGDRFSRADSIRTAASVARLLDAGVTRMFSAEGWIDWTDDIDRVLYNLKQDLAKSAYSKSLSRNVSRSMARLAAEGKWLSSSTPFAYVKGPDGRLAVECEEKAEVVRWTFRAYLDPAATLATVARELNRRGLVTGAGKRWTRYSVRSLLTNPRYTGDAVWNVLHKGKFHRVSGGGVVADKGKHAREAQQKRRGLKHLPPVRNAEADAVVVPNAHPALIDRETFQAVQDKLRASFRTRTTPHEGGGEWALSGLLHCAHCGCVMWGCRNVQKRGERTYVYRKYTCSGSRRHGLGVCRQRSVDPDEILGDVVAYLQERLGDAGAVAELEKEIAANRAASAEDFGARRAQLRAALEGLARQIDQGNANLALLPPDRLPGVIAKLRAWEAEGERLTRELGQLDLAEESGEELAGRAEEALACVRELHELVQEAEPAEVRAALAGMVKSVKLHFATRPPSEVNNKAGKGPIALDYFDVELQPEFAKLLGPAVQRCE